MEDRPAPQLNEKDKERFARSREKRRVLARAFDALTPEGKLGYIPVRPEPSEFEIQAYIYLGLLDRGFVVRGEVKTRCATCVFDLVVYHDSTPVRIIETKRHRRGMGSKTTKQYSKLKLREQLRRYAKFGVPVDLVCTLHDAKRYVERFEL